MLLFNRSWKEVLHQELLLGTLFGCWNAWIRLIEELLLRHVVAAPARVLSISLL